MTTPLDTAYLAAYNRLNPEQRAAVDAIEGPVMVIAGPGTGKTQILTLRIANILRQTDTPPESILALTFTKSGARAMRERLRQFVGEMAYRVPIMTFHGLAEDLIKTYPDAYETIIGSQAATDLERISYLETILADNHLTLLRPVNAPEFYIKPIITAISHMKQENVYPDDLARLISTAEAELANTPQHHEKGAHKGKERSEYKKLAERIEKQRALLLVYRQYEALMRENRRYDYDDMILETVTVLRENETVRLDLQERYQYILADEHQDVNGAQNEILLQLTSFHEFPNLFVVGDEKQAIYRFQGASLENFVFFESHFKNTTVIRLTSNYRSTQSILDEAHRLVAVEDGPLVDYRVPLIGQQSGEANPPKIVVYPHQTDEITALVEEVGRVLNSGEAPHEIAVIVRTNSQVATVGAALERAGILTEQTSDIDIQKEPLFKMAFDLLVAAADPGDETALAGVLLAPYWPVSLGDRLVALRERSHHLPLRKLLERSLAVEPDPVSAALAPIATVLATSLKQAATKLPHRLVADLFTESGFVTYATAAAPFSSARIIRRLYDEVEALVMSGQALTLPAIVTELKRRLEQNLPLIAPAISGTGTGVAVMTAHKAKGLEFNHVFIPHITKETWGGSKRPDYFKLALVRTAALELERNEDERRLLYVAMTRARQSLTMSYALTTAEGRELSPSPLLGTLIAPTEPGPAVAPLSVLVEKPLLPQVVRQALLQQLQTKGFSATSLNNFVKNPWDYFFRNVVRLPEVQTPALMFGTAMHAVLESVVKTHTGTGELLSFSDARSLLEKELGQFPLHPVEFTELFKKGQESLAVYLPHLANTLPKTAAVEVNIRTTLPINHPDLPEIPLTGKLDRIDQGADGQARRVVDYKTGRAKSRAEICGETAKADAGYRRQLTFYALLLTRHDDDRYRTTEGTLSFIEPTAKGVVKEESFTTTTTEIAALETLIAEAVEIILRGEFFYDTQLLAESEYATVGALWLETLRRANGA